jgi:hypothetical protein
VVRFAPPTKSIAARDSSFLSPYSNQKPDQHE